MKQLSLILTAYVIFLLLGAGAGFGEEPQLSNPANGPQVNDGTTNKLFEKLTGLFSRSCKSLALVIQEEKEKMAENRRQEQAQLVKEKIEKEAQKKVETAKAALRSMDNESKLAILKNAIDDNDTAMVKFYIEAEAIPQAGNELLAYASRKEDRIEFVKLFLSAGFKFDFGYSKAPLLNIAAARPNIELVRLLLDKGAPINSLDSSSQTPLIIAASLNNEEAIKLLLDNGADIEAQNMYGHNPLMVAAEKGHVKAIQLLLEKGAYIDAQNFSEYEFQRDQFAPADRMTALMYATRWGKVAAVEELVKRGANLLIKNKEGQTALDIAEEKALGPRMAPFAKIKKILEDAVKKARI